MQYLDKDIFIVCIKTEDICIGFAKDVEQGFDASNYELDKPLPERKHKKSNWINER